LSGVVSGKLPGLVTTPLTIVGALVAEPTPRHSVCTKSVGVNCVLLPAEMVKPNRLFTGTT
jgi:hypothetical protein